MKKKLRLTDFFKSVLIIAFLTFSQIGLGQTTVSYSFAQSGAVTGLNANPPIAVDANIGFSSFQNSSGTAPSIFSGQLRLYQNTTKGGSIKVFASNGVTITSVKVYASGSSGIGPAAFSADGANSSNLTISGGVYTMNSLIATNNVEFWSKGSSSTTRVYVDSFEVTYTLAGCTPPTTQSTLAFSSVTSFQMGVALSGGNGAGRVVVMNTADVFTAPTNGTNPTANAAYGGGQQVVYNGTGSSFSVTGLNPLTTYYFRSYDYCDTERSYNATAITYNQATLASTNPVLSVSGSLSHGSVCPSTAATPITYTITNNGINAADGITIDSDNLTEFVISGLSSTSIPGDGGTATYVVTFTPSSAGARSANLTITSTTSGSNSVNNALTGTGVVTPPTITTPTSTTVTYNSAILGGDVTIQGCSNITERGIYYSTTSGFANGAGTKVSETGTYTTGAFTIPVAGLTSNTIYYYKAFALSTSGTSYTSEGTFTTAVISAPVAIAASTITNASFEANWNSVGSAIEYRLDVSDNNLFSTTNTILNENFDNGTLANWSNVDNWTSNSSAPITGTNSLRLNAPSSQSTSYIYTQPATYDLTTGLTTWRFNIRPAYSPSNNNKAFFYLTSDQTNLTTANGYVVGYNFVGNDDVIKLWKSTSGLGITTPLVSSSQVASQNLTYGIEVTRTKDGVWELKTKVNGGFSMMTTAGSAVDNEYTISTYSGLVAFASSSNNTNLRFDDFSITREVSSILPLYDNLTVNALSQTVTGLNSGTNYYYRVRAVDANSTSSNSNVIEVTTTGPVRWISTTATNWSTASNWSNNAVPDGTKDIEIPVGNPILNTNFTVQTGKSLTLSGTGTLTVAPTASLTVQGTADFGGKAVLLQSSAAGDAVIGEITGTLSNATNVTVERYIPARRAWKALTTPLKGSDTSLYSAWQNGGATIANTGVEIWGPAGTNMPIGPNYSVLNYTPTGWANVTNTATANLFDTTGNNAYLVFVTGAYGSGNISNGLSAATTLKATGELITGNVVHSAIINSKHTLIGNPYASPLDPSKVLNGGVNLTPSFWVWDPSLATTGGYVSYDVALGTYSNSTGSYSTNSIAIQSGQAFFVKANIATTGLLTLSEDIKSSAVSNVFGKKANQNLNNSTNASILRVGMFKESNQEWKPLDGAVAGFYDTASNLVDDSDGKKFANGGENIAFVRNNIPMSSEHFSTPQPLDEMYIRVWNTSVNNYKLRINTESFTVPNIEATLVDLFTGVQTPLVLDGSIQEYPFAVTSATASTGDRFKVVFSASPLATTVFDTEAIKVYPNPATNGIVNVQLPQGDYTNYSYELVNVLGQKVLSNTIEVLSGNQFSFNTKGLANNWYALRILNAGKAVYQTKVIIAN